MVQRSVVDGHPCPCVADFSAAVCEKNSRVEAVPLPPCGALQSLRRCRNFIGEFNGFSVRANATSAWWSCGRTFASAYSPALKRIRFQHHAAFASSSSLRPAETPAAAGGHVHAHAETVRFADGQPITSIHLGREIVAVFFDSKPFAP